MKITAEEITESTILTTIAELFPTNLYTISITRDDTLELAKVYIYIKKPYGVLDKYARIKHNNGQWSYKYYAQAKIHIGTFCKVKLDIFCNLNNQQLYTLVVNHEKIPELFTTNYTEHTLFAYKKHAQARRKPIDLYDDEDYLSHELAYARHYLFEKDWCQFSNIQPIDIYENNKGKFIITPRADCTLRSYLDEYPLNSNKISLIAKEALHILLKNLVILNKKGIVHRDIHANNIFVYKDQQKVTYKLSDFGIAVIDGTSTKDYETCDAYFLHLAPEIYYDNEYTFCNKYDMWSIAIVIVEIISCGYYQQQELKIYMKSIIEKFIEATQKETVQIYINNVVDEIIGKSIISEYKPLLLDMLKLKQHERPNDINTYYIQAKIIYINEDNNLERKINRCLDVLKSILEFNKICNELYCAINNAFCIAICDHIAKDENNELLSALVAAGIKGLQEKQLIDEFLIITGVNIYIYLSDKKIEINNTLYQMILCRKHSELSIIQVIKYINNEFNNTDKQRDFWAKILLTNDTIDDIELFTTILYLQNSMQLVFNQEVDTISLIQCLAEKNGDKDNPIRDKIEQILRYSITNKMLQADIEYKLLEYLFEELNSNDEQLCKHYAKVYDKRPNEPRSFSI